jgi:hypothetical protein
MTFNEFQRELSKRISDRNVSYMLALTFEHNMALNKQLDDMAGIILNMADELGRLVMLNKHTQLQLAALQRRNDNDLVQSVIPTPEEDEQ